MSEEGDEEDPLQLVAFLVLFAIAMGAATVTLIYLWGLLH